MSNKSAYLGISLQSDIISQETLPDLKNDSCSETVSHDTMSSCDNLLLRKQSIDKCICVAMCMHIIIVCTIPYMLY